MEEKKKKLLLIEDEDFIRELYARQLRLAGFEVDPMPNGNDGLAASKKADYDMVLLDIMLPDINGLEVLKKIKEDPQTQKMRVVLLTNLGQDSVQKEGASLGAVGYLIKASYTPNQIVEEIKKLIAAGDNVQPMSS